MHYGCIFKVISWISKCLRPKLFETGSPELSNSISWFFSRFFTNLDHSLLPFQATVLAWEKAGRLLESSTKTGWKVARRLCGSPCLVISSVTPSVISKTLAPRSPFRLWTRFILVPSYPFFFFSVSKSAFSQNSKVNVKDSLFSKAKFFKRKCSWFSVFKSKVLRIFFMSKC